MKTYKLVIGADHGGFNLKAKLIEFLTSEGHAVEDYGTYTTEPCDYPDIAFKVANAIKNEKFDRGILVCKSGQGITIAANKVKGIRAVCCSDTYCARMSVAHNDSNILALGEMVVGEEKAKDILRVWLNSSFEGGRHLRRVQKIEKFELDQINNGTPQPTK